MIKYFIMLALALGIYFAGKAVLRSAKKGGCVGCPGGCDCGGSCGGGADCGCSNHKQITKK